VQAQRLGDLPAHGVQRVQRRHRLLEDHADAVAAQRAPAPARAATRSSGLEADRARRPWRLGQQAHQRQRGDRLAAARLADQASTLLTGGIGLMKVDPFWLAVKEAAVPALIGVVVLGSNWTRWPLIRILVFNPTLFDVDRVNAALAQRGTTVPFELRLRTGTLWLAGTFFFSAVMNFVLARWIVTSPAGSEAFNEELGKLTLVSYPAIAVPSMLMMMGLMWWLATGARKLTGLDLAEMLRG
jgi:hypothetical protein